MARWFADTGGYKTAWLGAGNHVRVFRRGNLFFFGRCKQIHVDTESVADTCG